MNAFRILIAVCVGAPLTIILFIVWLPLAALETAARGMKGAVTAIDNFLSKYLIEPITNRKR